MVRRLLLTALVATLAVALPAAADEDPAASAPPEQAVGPACQPFDLSCLPGPDLDVVECDSSLTTCSPDTSGLPEPGDDEGLAEQCKAYEFTMPGDGPMTQIVVIDPEGCIRNYIRRTLGWPPSGQDPLHTYVLTPAIDLLPWH
jgi:hypothetical protein